MRKYTIIYYLSAVMLALTYMDADWRHKLVGFAAFISGTLSLSLRMKQQIEEDQKK
jgi:hypothetical protein